MTWALSLLHRDVDARVVFEALCFTDHRAICGLRQSTNRMINGRINLAHGEGFVVSVPGRY